MSVGPCIVNDMRKETNQMLHNGLLNLWFAQHISGIIVPIIRSLRL